MIMIGKKSYEVTGGGFSGIQSALFLADSLAGCTWASEPSWLPSSASQAVWRNLAIPTVLTP